MIEELSILALDSTPSSLTSTSTMAAVPPLGAPDELSADPTAPVSIATVTESIAIVSLES